MGVLSTGEQYFVYSCEEIEGHLKHGVSIQNIILRVEHLVSKNSKSQTLHNLKFFEQLHNATVKNSGTKNIVEN